MNRLETTVLLAAVLQWAAMAEGGVAPTLELYTQTNHNGAVYTITGPHHNLANEGFNDVTRSICGIGLWFLYEDKDYSKHSKFVHTFASPTYDCENLESSQRDKVSSLRYAGMDDIDFPTLTLYHDKNQCGGEFLVLRDTDTLPDFNNKATTFAVTGSSSWTVYSDADYKGDSACMTPGEDGGWYYGVWTYSDLSMKNDVVSSVRKGCHSDRVYEYDLSSNQQNLASNSTEGGI